MMRSSMNDNTGGDDDFAPNPFRSDTTTDFFDAPPPQPDPFAPQQQYHQQAPPPPNNYHHQQQQQPYGGVDPNSGMTGSIPIPPQPEKMDPVNPSQYLAGEMDTSQNSRNYGGTVDNGPPPSIFSWRGIMGCCKMDTIVTLFDVDSIDIYLRLKASVLQFYQPDVFRTSVIGDLAVQTAANDGRISPSAATTVPVSDRKGPDLYGPFWISMTLMFILGMTSNLSDYMHHHRKADPDATFEYDIDHLLKALYIVGVFSFCIPTMFWLICHCLGMPSIAWSMWTCVYGYSMVPICVGALCAWWLPYELWHWLVLAGSVGCSGLMVIRNLSTPILAQDAVAGHAKAAPLLLGILAAHACILLTLKITFYP